MPPRYMTPARYRTLGLGIDLSARSDVDLAALLDTASALANSYCNAPSGHDFRGGAVTNEMHEWRPGNTHEPGSYRVFPYHIPIKSVERLSIQLTNTQQLSFDQPSQLFIQRNEHWLEPIAAANTTALFFAVPPFGLRVPVSKTDYHYGWAFTETEVLVQVAGRVYQAANQFWTDDDIEVTLNDVATSSGDYVADPYEGTITFGTLPDPTAVARLTYTYPLPTNIARATSFITTDLLGYSNINASGLTGLSGIRVEEIELRQSAKVGFGVVAVNPAAQALLHPYSYVVFG